MAGLPETTSRRGLLVGLAVGLPVIAYGVRGLLVDADRTQPAELARWIVGAAVVNDALVVPLAMGAAWLARRMTPARAWPPMRSGLLATGVVLLVAWPFVRGYGRDPTIPSLLDRNYAVGVAAAIGATWIAVAVWIAVSIALAIVVGRRRGRRDR
jgi:hypothetical protein